MFGDPLKDWVHRIDFVPAFGQRIEFRRGDEPSRFALVVAPSARDDYFAGMGDDVRLDPEDSTGVLLIPSLTYTHWRYAPPK